MQGVFHQRGQRHWRLVTDTVMGGVSNGQLTVEEIDGRPLLRLFCVGRIGYYRAQ
jgi:hypothetical protein